MIPDAVRLPFSFDPARLRTDLAIAADIGWTDHFVKRNYEGSWSAIALRGPAYATHPVQMIYSDPTCTDFRDTPVLARCPYFQSVLGAFECPLHAVRLMSLDAGSVILEHTDHDLSAEAGHARIHIPITTNPGVTFLLNQRRVVMSEGECWYLRLSDPHSVRNDGTSARVHLVIDTVANEWLMGQMALGTRAR
ncbi:MAG: aspartyl/asparaginyl beta-hydroxylase domain-containing protein [Gemmatimonadota bacterium]